MNQITAFHHQQFGQVRSLMRSGDPWFVAADVCRALDIINNRDALSRLDEDEKRYIGIDLDERVKKISKFEI